MARLKRIVFRRPWRRVLGLMFQTPQSRTLYVFDFGGPVRHGFHMLFVFHPIDLYFLDEKKRIIDMKKGFRPFTAYKPTKTYHYAVETAPGLLDAKKGGSLKKVLK